MKKIWIIDDDTITRFMITRTLSKLPFETEIIEFSDGSGALENLRKGATEEGILPDIVLLDLYMPIMDGWDFLRELENLYVKNIDRIKFLILTSSMDPKDEKKGAANKYVSAFLRKPLNINEFIKSVGTVEANGDD